MFVSGNSAHIPYARLQAALHSGDLAFIRAHAPELTLSLVDGIEVCRLIAGQEPDQLEAASVRWIRRFAAEACDQRRNDYLLIVRAFDAMAAKDEPAAGPLAELCAKRGL